MEGVDAIITLHLNRQHAIEVAKNKKILLKILSCIKYLARQGLPLRGHDDDSDSNFLMHCGEDYREIHQWLEKKFNKYTSHEIQNSLIKIMALSVIRKVSENLHKSPFLAVMIDKTTDVTNQGTSHNSYSLDNDNFEVYEEFIGLYAVPCIDAAILFSVIKDTLTRLNLAFHKYHGWLY